MPSSKPMQAGASSRERIVESIEFWMRAYPRRCREAHGQELLDLVADLAGPGAQRVDARSAFDLVRGGWATRWREHPLPHTWLLYRMVDHRVPAAYRSWALDDIDGFWYPMRRFLGNAWPIFLIVLITSPPRGSGEIPVTSLVIVDLMVVSSMFIRPEWYAARPGSSTSRPGSENCRSRERSSPGTFRGSG